MDISVFTEEMKQKAEESIKDSISRLESEFSNDEISFNNARSSEFNRLLSCCLDVLGKYQQLVDTNVRVYNPVTFKYMNGIEQLNLHYHIEIAPLLKEFSDKSDELYFQIFPQRNNED
ncbi:hypothetical protein D3C87_14570 [compost metagenome]